MVPPRPLISNRNWNPSCLKWHIVPLKWYSRRKGNGGFQFSRDQFPIAPTLPPALYPCIGTPENWAQQTVVCFNASLHCCVPWSSRKHHIPQQKFKRKTLCNPNREGTKLEKKKHGPPSPSSSQFLWSMRLSLQIASTPRGFLSRLADPKQEVALPCVIAQRTYSITSSRKNREMVTYWNHTFSKRSRRFFCSPYTRITWKNRKCIHLIHLLRNVGPHPRPNSTSSTLETTVEKASWF